MHVMCQDEDAHLEATMGDKRLGTPHEVKVVHISLLPPNNAACILQQERFATQMGTRCDS
jgi:hypothetical protein